MTVERILERVRALPGVSSAGAVSVLPFSRANASTSFTVEGRETPPGGVTPYAEIRLVSHSYFEAMGIPLRRGRTFAATDTADAPGVALVDEKLAREYWPSEDPIGKRVRRRVGVAGPWFTIVGITRHVLHRELDAESKGALYLSLAQNRTPNLTIVARTANDPEGLAGAAQGAVAEVDKDLPVWEIRTMEQRMLETLTPRRFSMYLLGVFASVAVALSAVGIYGVMAQSVSQRTHEIGIRMAVGADGPRLVRLIVGQGMAMAGMGLVTGAGAALGLTRLMSRLLFGVTPTDPATFVGVAAVLAVVALASSYLPARRATRVDPAVALRYE